MTYKKKLIEVALSLDASAAEARNTYSQEIMINLSLFGEGDVVFGEGDVVP